MKILMVDVDGVLIRSPPGGWSRDLQADLGLPQHVLETEFFDIHWAEIAVGRASLPARLGPVLERCAPHLTARGLMDYWFRRDAEVDSTFLGQLEPLRASGVALHLATNQEHERAAFLWKTLGLQDHFAAMHYSADVGWAKPDPGFFTTVVARTGYAPADLTLVDDRPENVAAARQAGWGGLYWDGTGTLADLLAKGG
ncbi:MAG: HAD-IA family hydrolase [Phenylobacterium sp.]|uniref:HAD family hydrolase n=1 Tax=Phenylobacterium sp. TaxID=1871053 RepID=UPI0025E55206|nr:HAD-IA family hydrolase [Phenylobacterium sp.]MCA6224069.1 HAD-IA family hydrolase [Phenylobacterium sp.]MCA6225428.1 HAD-IA family hydrolase [Phenylobacterium sp.]MCA6233038.1 HAD-IA family hydrolase [Phenylobacterium sp.]MCA6234980.1 HAD-IA family hydrolase [Phenylobacterium sp.]MCA6250044.1 HAD-IA family hydrolase [Phenylobacterium sp.]